MPPTFPFCPDWSVFTDVQPGLLPPLLPLSKAGGYAQGFRRSERSGKERDGKGPGLRGGVCFPQPEQEPAQAAPLGGRRLRGILQEARKGHLRPPGRRHRLPGGPLAGTGDDGRGHTGGKIQAKTPLCDT